MNTKLVIGGFVAVGILVSATIAEVVENCKKNHEDELKMQMALAENAAMLQRAAEQAQRNSEAANDVFARLQESQNIIDNLKF